MPIPAGADETVDELRGWQLRVIQKRQGYRFSLDPLLLADFAPLPEGGRVIDLGTGCGIIPLLLARRNAGASVVGVEFQSDMAGLAERNARLNGLADRIAIVRDDILHLRDRFPVSSFDLVCANPPFRTRRSGRTSPRVGRNEARHESTAGLADFLAVAKYLVKPHGRIAFIHHPSRLAELFVAAAALKLAPLRLRLVHDTTGAAARMVLLEFAKGRTGTLAVLEPLLVRSPDGEYGAEVVQIMRGCDAC